MSHLGLISSARWSRRLAWVAQLLAFLVSSPASAGCTPRAQLQAHRDFREEGDMGRELDSPHLASPHLAPSEDLRHRRAQNQGPAGASGAMI